MYHRGEDPFTGFDHLSFGAAIVGRGLSQEAIACIAAPAFR
jgi:hypothetical protein